MEPNLLRDAAPHGVLRAVDLEELGVPRRSIYRRCRDNGPWQRLLPGVIMLHSGPPTPSQRLAAALIYGGPDSMVTGLQACRRYGVSRGPAPQPTVLLLVPNSRQMRASEFVRLERTLRLPAATVMDGLRFAPAARACLDAARRVRDPRQVTELLADAIRRELCTVAELAVELAAGGQRGSATPRSVLADLGAGVRSVAEVDAKTLWSGTGLPEPVWNAPVYNVHGQLLAVVDAWFEDVALAWEIESIDYHVAPGDFARTMRRTSRLVAEGATVLPSLPTQLRHERAAVARQLVEAYRAAARRPRPPLHTNTTRIPSPRQPQQPAARMWL
ncbi:hypothetical protein [Pseudonocardia spinosispora]|uniref:hypothetical protein n=1 Tax=Pseudonocardia spinosispora TaxID=103441 RepID=UPI00041EF401|nr:hypothetical protein [Pseudonocardia spinosispora]